MTSDGVVSSATIDTSTQTITLTTSLGDDVDIDVSTLLDDFLTQAQVDARARVRYTDGEKSDVQGLVFARRQTCKGWCSQRKDRQRAGRLRTAT